MQSVWTDSTEQKRFPKLSEDRKTEILIVRGGMAGVLCAYFLKQAGFGCILAEAERIGGGITKNTTAKITAQHGLIYDSIIRQYGAEKAKEYLEVNLAALARYRTLCKGMDCDFEDATAYVYGREEAEPLQREAEAYRRIGADGGFVSDVPLPFSVAGAVRLDHQAQFHPLQFISQIAEGLPIYEDTFIREVKGHKAVTDDGYVIEADKIIITTHFPFINTKGGYFLKMYQHRSYVLALEGAPRMEGMLVDMDKKGLSFRQYKDLLLLGGGSHRTGKKGGGFQELEAFAAAHYKGANMKYRWATQDCMTLDGIPYIGRYGKHTPDLFVATGFNKWGMTSSMAAAMILCEMIKTGKENTDSVFYPSRSIMKPQLLLNGAESAMNLLAPLPRRCTHLGCALHWNKAERSWDCPCHGSRYDEQGQLIDNPAMRRKHFE